MKNPLISVVVPIHNGAQWLKETLDSLFEQTYPHFEIVLIDDASNDALLKVLGSFMDDRLLVTHLKKNVGVSAARNLGISFAKGEYIAFCDADDVCHPQRFEKQLNFLEKNLNIDLCGTAFTCFDTIDRQIVINPVSNEEIRKALMFGNAFGLSTVMARADVLKINQFNECLSVSEDYDLWTRLAVSGISFANLPDKLLRYRWHPLQASRGRGENLDQTARRIRSEYCAGILNAPHLLTKLRSASIEFDDLEEAVRYVTSQNIFKPRDFRFMLAWMYQRLPDHGWLTWLKWRNIQKQLQLDLDWNYRLNIFLLACLPYYLGNKYFDILIKLKR